MTETALRVTVVDADLVREPYAWGDAAGDWQPAALAWVGRLAALGVPFEVRDRVEAERCGLVVVPEPGCTDIDGADVTGPPPDTAEATLSLIAERLGAVVVPDLRGVLVLRLDDPGAAGKEHLSWWAHEPVTTAGWDALWTALDGFGRVSIFCCPGYVRADGTVADSREVLPEEWTALDAGVRRGVADLECHGYTHMHPDLDAWLAADDRRDNEAWFRELWPPNVDIEPSVQAQADRLARWQAALGIRGTALVAPGERWGNNTIVAARRCGFALFNSWSICRLDTPTPAWTTGVGSPYLTEPDERWFADCLPQVGYWHDRDMALGGPDWVARRLAAWRDCGAAHAWSFADLARAYEPIDAELANGEVTIRSAPDARLRVVRG